VQPEHPSQLPEHPLEQVYPQEVSQPPEHPLPQPEHPVQLLPQLAVQLPEHPSHPPEHPLEHPEQAPTQVPLHDVLQVPVQEDLQPEFVLSLKLIASNAATFALIKVTKLSSGISSPTL
jgi:hypothetical protein